MTTGYSHDAFNDGTNSWHEFDVSIGRETPSGTVLVRGTNAARFGYTDQLIEMEAYPRLRAGTYAFVNLGAATRRDLFPEHRAAFDLYQSRRGRRRGFGRLSPAPVLRPRLDLRWDRDQIPGTVGPHRARLLRPGDESDSWSFHTESRRYFGSAGTSYIAATVQPWVQS